MALPVYQPGVAEAYVKEKGWRYKTSGDELVLETCPFCNEGPWKFYINNVLGAFNCKRASCSKRGNLYTLQRELGDAQPVRAISASPATAPKRTPISALARYEHDLEQSEFAQNYLATRGLSPDTAKRWHLGLKKDRGRDILLIPYLTKDGEVADVKYRHLDPDAPLPKYWRKGGGESILFGEHLLPGKDQPHDVLYLCEGEIDCMTLWQHGFSPALSTTAGAGTFKPRWYDIIKAYAPKRIVVCYDSDPAGQKGAEELARKFDEFECINIVLPDAKDVNEYFQLHSVQDFQDLVAAAKPPEIEEIVHVSSVCDDLESQLFLGESAFVGLPSQFGELNSLISGGYWNGFIVTVSGVRGTGKTSFVLQELLQAAGQSIPSYMLCLEMQKTMMLRKIIEHKFHIQMTKQTHADVQRCRAQLDRMPFYMGDRIKDLDTMERAVRQAVKRYGLRIMAFDNINFFARSIENQTNELAAAMKRLKELAVDLNIPIIVIAQPTKAGSNVDERIMTMNDMKGAGAIADDSDVVILLHRRAKRTNVKDIGQRSGFQGNQSPLTLVRVDKARYSAGGEMYLMFSGETSSYRELTREERESLVAA